MSYYELLSFRPLEEIEQFKASIAEGKNPRDIKVLLAKELIARFHSEADAEAAEQEFVNRFAKNQIPDEMPEFEFDAGLPVSNFSKKQAYVRRPLKRCVWSSKVLRRLIARKSPILSLRHKQYLRIPSW